MKRQHHYPEAEDPFFGRMNDPTAAASAKGLCGDEMEFHLVIHGDRITDIRYYTNGCGNTRAYGSRTFWPTVVVGYFGSIGIATLSDCIIPFIGETLLELPNRGLHLGVVEKWWLVNPMAFAGIGVSLYRPSTRFPHTGHVLLSTWASLFHIQMALSDPPSILTVAAVGLFLFLAVWIPCCTSDIVFPLLAAGSIRAHEKGQGPRRRVTPIHPCHGTEQISRKESSS